MPPIYVLFAMRQLAIIPHPEVKITLFSWNGKYLIKLEKGPLEQTYKVSELDLTGEEDIHLLLDQDFIQAAVQRFGAMQQDLQAAFDRHGI
ncbi:hypothetical protein [Hymenobacter glacieicola]|uniref:Uncharacterized protein n=1 Tax=Hymenobacter glacieicola TaxID=1562124 RepID=A0ABQ1WH18_9BACT|nr:hypothetical protein [Hymenobacter glacieicola]GGG30380.1 hypothetical protein GCM10011378_03760 [Hymenobacter glacieicola]